MIGQRKKKETYPIVDESRDYIWRFKLDPEKVQISRDDAFVDLFRSQLQDLLKIVVLTKNGKRVRVDAFRFINDMEKEYKIFEDRQRNR